MKTFIFIDSINIIPKAKAMNKWVIDFKKPYDYLLVRQHFQKKIQQHLIN